MTIMHYSPKLARYIESYQHEAEQDEYDAYLKHAEEIFIRDAWGGRSSTDGSQEMMTVDMANALLVEKRATREELTSTYPWLAS